MDPVGAAGDCKAVGETVGTGVAGALGGGDAGKYRCVSDGDMPAELLRWGDPQLMMEKKRVSVPVVPLVRLRRQVQKGCSPAVVG